MANATTPNSVPIPPAPGHSKFMNGIPLELRKMIYDLVLPGPRFVLFGPLRTLEEAWNEGLGEEKCYLWDQVSSRVTFPIGFWINKEWRKHNQESLKLSFSESLGQRPVYFNYKIDTLLLRDPYYDALYEHKDISLSGGFRYRSDEKKQLLETEKKLTFSKVRSIALREFSMGYLVGDMLEWFPNVEEVIFTELHLVNLDKFPQCQTTQFNEAWLRHYPEKAPPKLKFVDFVLDPQRPWPLEKVCQLSKGNFACC
jgi:hypothetical protein